MLGQALEHIAVPVLELVDERLVERQCYSVVHYKEQKHQCNVQYPFKLYTQRRAFITKNRRLLITYTALSVPTRIGFKFTQKLT